MPANALSWNVSNYVNLNFGASTGPVRVATLHAALPRRASRTHSREVSIPFHHHTLRSSCTQSTTLETLLINNSCRVTLPDSRPARLNPQPRTVEQVTCPNISLESSSSEPMFSQLSRYRVTVVRDYIRCHYDPSVTFSVYGIKTKTFEAHGINQRVKP